jgi:hypothetical protein
MSHVHLFCFFFIFTLTSETMNSGIMVVINSCVWVPLLPPPPPPLLPHLHP